VVKTGKNRQQGTLIRNRFLTIGEVAELLKLSERTVYQLTRDGRLGGAAKIGGQWRFEPTALHAWLKAGGEIGQNGSGPTGDLQNPGFRNAPAESCLAHRRGS
jgi:excisionase family DNA binding protein